MRHVLLSACAVALAAAAQVQPQESIESYRADFLTHFKEYQLDESSLVTLASHMLDKRMLNDQHSFVLAAAQLYCSSKVSKYAEKYLHDFVVNITTNNKSSLKDSETGSELPIFTVLSSCQQNIKELVISCSDGKLIEKLESTSTVSTIILKLLSESKISYTGNSTEVAVEIDNDVKLFISQYTRPALIIDLAFKNDKFASLLIKYADPTYVEYSRRILNQLGYTELVNTYFNSFKWSSDNVKNKSLYECKSDIIDAAKSIPSVAVSPLDKLAVSSAKFLETLDWSTLCLSLNAFGSDTRMSIGDRMLFYLALNSAATHPALSEIYQLASGISVLSSLDFPSQKVQLSYLLFDFFQRILNGTNENEIIQFVNGKFSSTAHVERFLHSVIKLLHLRSTAAADSLDSVRYPDNVIVCVSTMYAERKISLREILSGHIPCRCLHDEKNMYEIGAMSRYIQYGQPQCLEEASKMFSGKTPYWNDGEFTVLTDTFKLYVSTLLKTIIVDAYQEAHIMTKAMYKIFCVSFVGKVTINDKDEVLSTLFDTVAGVQISHAMLLFSQSKENLSQDEKRALLTEHANTLREHQRPAVLTHRDNTYFPFESTGTIDATFFARQSDAVRLGEVMKRIEERQKKVKHYADFGSGWYIFLGVVLVIAVSACCLCRRRPKKTEVPITHTNSEEATADVRKEVEEEETKRPDVAV